ncbi:MAG TPA: hypothetical protein VGA92_00915 [Candidatus Nitrosotenuis sp.]
MSKTVSARIPKEMHGKLIEMCNKIGCTVNEYLTGSLELALDGTTEKELGLDMDDESEPETKIDLKKQENKPIPEAKITKISYDNGKTWINI